MVKGLFTIISLFLLSYIQSQHSTNKTIDFPKKDIFLILTDETIDEAFSTYENIFLISTSDWCIECSTIIDKYLAVIQSFPSPLPNTQYAIIDCEYNRKSLYRLGINVYPSINYIHKGKDYGIYDDKLSYHYLIAYIEDKAIPISPFLSTKNKIEKLRTIHDAVLVYFGTVQEDIRKISNLIYEIDYVKFITFDCAGNEDMLYFYKVKQQRTLVILKNFDDLRSEMVMTDDVSIKQLEMFIKVKGIPIVMGYDRNVQNFIMENHRPAFFLIQSNTISSNYTQNDFSYNNMTVFLAKKYRGQYYFVGVLNENATKYEAFLNNNQIDKNKLPGLFFYNNTFKRISSNNESEIENMLQKRIKSNIIAKDNDITRQILSRKSLITYLDERTFEHEVNDNNQDVLVYFFSHSSSISRTIMSFYEDTALKYINRKKLKFTQIDASLYSIPGIVKNQFPMLMFFPSNDKHQKIYFKGAGSISSIEDFIKEHSTY